MAVSARHFARLGVVQYLYFWSIQSGSIDRADEQILIDSNVLVHGDLAYFQKLLKSIPPRISEIDQILEKVIHRKLDSIDLVELAILRLGVYEMIAEYDVPLKVITNECIELSREFGNPGSYKFINGTLDKLAFSDKVKPGALIGRRQGGAGDGETELINRYFANRQGIHESVLTGIGDDCAIVDIADQKQLLITTDTLLENVHFPADTNPRNVGYKSLAVSLSDLASKGAKPVYATMNLSLPNYDKEWLDDFGRGFFELSSEYGVSLIGGDTVRGPLSISITAFGLGPECKSPLRLGARAGDAIYVTGTLGDAALGLVGSRLGVELDGQETDYIQRRLERPKPRVEAGQAIALHASSSIDLSDGLMADLSRILKASGVGAIIELEKIPLSPVYRKLLAEIGWDCALARGDDYELCFTAGETLPSKMLKSAKVPISQIGVIIDGEGIELRQPDGEKYNIEVSGYSHF